VQIEINLIGGSKALDSCSIEIFVQQQITVTAK